MEVFNLEVKKRTDLGKTDCKKLRKEGKIPCVIYGGKTNEHFYTDIPTVRNLIYSPHSYIVNIDLEGKKMYGVLKHIQYHPVTDALYHIDFYEVFEDKKFVVEIPVSLNGFAVGVQAGGKLTTLKRKLKIQGLMKDLPNILNIDITNLALGKSIKISELKFDNLEILDPKNSILCSIKLTRAAKGAADAPGAEAAAEVKA